jgi:Protein of unknown function (DUF3164)
MTLQTNTAPTLSAVERAQAALARVGDGTITIGGNKYMPDPSGRLVPIELMAPANVLEDQTVRTLIGFAWDISDQIARFRGHTFEDVGSFLDLLHEKYQVSRGGSKGNVTLTSYDGRYRVQVQVQDQLTFGPELQVAKTLVDACIVKWAEGTDPKIRALVEHAFNVDQLGRINRSALFALRRLAIDDDQWRAAMQAIGDAIRVIGSKEYVRFYKREGAHRAWEPITVDLAKAVS